MRSGVQAGGPARDASEAAAGADHRVRRAVSIWGAAAELAGFDAREVLPPASIASPGRDGAGPIVWLAAAPYRRGEGRRGRRR